MHAGSTDYWVNDRHGRPFFVIDKVVDSGLVAALRDDIVPQLLREVPNQPTPVQLRDDPFLCRFVLVFDREGYSPGFFKSMWEDHRIACVTYHKHPGAPWDEAEFRESEITLSSGEKVTMRLAERGSLVGGGADAMWMKEVRKLTAGGRQVSVVGTAYKMQPDGLSAALFSRWCQENYFRYSMQHFAIDLLGEYKTTPLHDTEQVINPAWRELERQRNALENKLRHRRARFASLGLLPLDAADDRKYHRRERQRAELLEEITAMEAQLMETKALKKQTKHHIAWAELDEADRFEKPVLGRKRLLDAVHMIAYRAETALCSLVRSANIDNAAARRLLPDLFVTEADIRPDPSAGVLHVEVHRSSRPVTDRTLAALFEHCMRFGNRRFAHLNGYSCPASRRDGDDRRTTCRNRANSIASVVRERAGMTLLTWRVGANRIDRSLRFSACCHRPSDSSTQWGTDFRHDSRDRCWRFPELDQHSAQLPLVLKCRPWRALVRAVPVEEGFPDSFRQRNPSGRPLRAD